VGPRAWSIDLYEVSKGDPGDKIPQPPTSSASGLIRPWTSEPVTEPTQSVVATIINSFFPQAELYPWAAGCGPSYAATEGCFLQRTFRKPFPPLARRAPASPFSSFLRGPMCWSANEPLAIHLVDMAPELRAVCSSDF